MFEKVFALLVCYGCKESAAVGGGEVVVKWGVGFLLPVVYGVGGVGVFFYHVGGCGDYVLGVFVVGLVEDVL